MNRWKIRWFERLDNGPVRCVLCTHVHICMERTWEWFFIWTMFNNDDDDDDHDDLLLCSFSYVLLFHSVTTTNTHTHRTQQQGDREWWFRVCEQKRYPTFSIIVVDVVEAHNIGPIQKRKIVCETNIVILVNTICKIAFVHSVPSRKTPYIFIQFSNIEYDPTHAHAQQRL